MHICLNEIRRAAKVYPFLNVISSVNRLNKIYIMKFVLFSLLPESLSLFYAARTSTKAWEAPLFFTEI